MIFRLLPAAFASSLLLSAAIVHADDAAIAKQLEALGGKVTAKDGIVSQVTFTDCSKLGDAEFRAIGQLTHLKGLTLYGKCHGLTDATVVHFAGLKELETLGTDGAQFTDDGLKQLTALSSLKSASFFHTSFGMKGFTGTGFGHLKGCPKLEKLTVAGISMGDEGFAAIATITQLKDFSTWHTYQTAEGNAHIAKLPNLTKLNLGQRLPHGGITPVSLSDATLQIITGMKTLESLKLGEARFTLEALRTLNTIPKLTQFNLHTTDFASADLEKLRAELPNVTITFEPLTDEQRKKLESYLKQ